MEQHGEVAEAAASGSQDPRRGAQEEAQGQRQQTSGHGQNGQGMRIETQGRNRLKDAGSEFVGSQNTLNSLEALGIRAYNPDEVERNVVQQLERQMDAKGQSVKPLSVFLDEADLETKISAQGDDEVISIDQFSRMTTLLERSVASRMRARARNNSQGVDHSRTDELQIKLQLMRMLLARAKAKVAAEQRRAQAEARAQAQERARQDAARRAREEEARAKALEEARQHATSRLAAGKRSRQATDPFARKAKTVEARKRQRVADALDVGAAPEPPQAEIKPKSVVKAPSAAGKRPKKEKTKKTKSRKSKVSPAKKRTTPEEGYAECPLCFRHFPTDTIEAHASRCSTRGAARSGISGPDGEDDAFSNADDSDSAVSSPDSEQDGEEEEGAVEALSTSDGDATEAASKEPVSRHVMDDLHDEDYESRRVDAKQRNATWAFHWEQAVDDGKSEAEADAYAQEMEDADSGADDVAQRETSKYHRLEGGLRLPRRTWSKLFDYQREAMEWFWDLHRKSTGGILGDEMGLGKTVQMGSFLGALRCSKILEASIVACPATTIAQWVSELNTWAPQTRIYVLHSSGLAMAEGQYSRAKVIAQAVKHKAILVTTYQGLRMSRDLLLRRRWGYVVLDEGHKVRNPDAEITMVCKQFQTYHRIIMSGSPIQNNLRELWTLVDFVAPGLLGTLPMFERSFSIPINQGGYASASAAQVQAAYQCAKVLKETIDPHLIRRMKKDVAQSLPEKHEQIIFCNLTRVQRDAYKAFIARPEVEELIHSTRGQGSSSRTTFKLIRALQHICNHPDIYFDKLRQAAALKGKDAWEALLTNEADDASGGDWIKRDPLDRMVNRSGKLMVLRIIMRNWFQEGHRVLLFSQGRLMLDILQRFLELEGYPFLRMDGTTQVSTRSKLINRFNDRKQGVFVFLLTTKVGGLGINLTGANRVLIYDPDWNPSTDTQARERAWRIGQTRQVTIYRLITGGTIEEKIYHRQIFKQYLSNKILTDARQSRFSKVSNMRDLFSLDESGGLANEEQRKESKKEKSKTSFSLRRKKRRQQQQQNLDGVNQEPEELTAAEVEANEAAARRAVAAVHTETSELFGGDNVEGGGAAGSNSTGGGDGNILGSLFDHSGFRQAFEHNVVERAASSTPDQRIVAEEALRIARRAAEALRRDQERTRRDASTVHIPTWTGQSGDAGRFGGAASAQLLQRLREQGSSTAAAESHIQALLADTNDPHMRLLRELLAFLSSGSEARDTGEILAHFANHPDRPDAELFRQMLRQLANLRNGRWVVKPAFATQ
ncbi:DNA repair protein rhp26 [Hondaea fermentalgiana]|uniref:DNA repair protein rhp26 n=1 Tax=Hondaea fermentalgiana TaxID=2315210 RepID=A0A2R5GJA0_9STRA|nr:DNA repair protein rhp26 [Hondaea fermentalgiana]|eukprot:GBG28733.1 DNA repair protein rhp26 [Hondaea fermentalgiana]